MLMTDEWMTIIEHAEELTDILLSSEVVDSYRQAHAAVYTDVELAKSIREFTVMKERYEEVQRFGRYHPDYNIVMKSIRVQKRELDLNEQVAELRIAENDVQQLFDEVGAIVARSVSESVKVPAGSAFFTSSSCDSGCGSGGSCSCSA
ncbi:YlbF family regulator [Sporosarcina sp. G11-34]|uniref:YlbF family regulator n=1 Tax=Sporosarcina sp. G11-34 TaxID=2849605 RepID=UPI0022A8EB99|nr:YlbF family regulator [Sporosarcina sp. G11-34]MCZ2258897.1 YlbF family regulator [Sporosarcina sp. G11-34]